MERRPRLEGVEQPEEPGTVANSAALTPSSTKIEASSTVQPFAAAYFFAWSTWRATDFCSSATPV
ncbi:MAG TPA: hypothetical protein VK504_29500 [Vicinamibacterales bacterium]|nr:hypothetical protein [Vicinamibacterales bacterium]